MNKNYVKPEDIKGALAQGIDKGQVKDAILSGAVNRGISRIYDRWMFPSQIAGCFMVLAWPLGAAFGWFGIAAMAGSGVLLPVVSLSQAKRESDELMLNPSPETLGQYLNEEDVIEFSALMKAVEGGTAKKLMGAPESTTETSPLPTAPNQAMLTSKDPKWPDGEHLFMVGLSGGAKTTVLQGITAQTKDPVVYLTIKTDDKAPPHWHAYRLDKFAGEKLLNQLLWLLDTLESWVRSGKKHRLVIDEYVSLQDAAKAACKLLPKEDERKSLADRFENLVKLYIRTGRSDGHYLGLLSQTPNGTDNFGSAKTQQGLRVFLCASEKSSEKFRFLVPWAKQMFADLITDEVMQTLKGITSGYWHLFADGGQLVLNQTQKPVIAQVACKECPTHLSGKELKPVAGLGDFESKVLHCLGKAAGNRKIATASQVRKAFASQDRPEKIEVEQCLNRLTEHGKIQTMEDSGTLYFYLA